MYNRKRIALVLTIIVAVAGATAYLLIRNNMNGRSADKTSSNSSVTPSVKSHSTAFNRDLYSLDSPESPWVIVNKQRSLEPVDFSPRLVIPDVPLRLNGENLEMQLSDQIAPAVKEMFAAAKKDNLDLMLASGYRSYQQQDTVYKAEIARNGRQEADRESARPGHSEHQTGLALDIEPASRKCEVQECFADTPEGKWLATNAYSYGFALRYIKDKENITGYKYEPWHFRYVGKELAAELKRQGYPPLESFFGLGAAPDYPQ